MGTPKNRKLCWNCDGSVHTHATKCPYCSTDLSESAPVTLSATAPPPPYAAPEPQLVARRVTPQPPYNTTPLHAEPPPREEPTAMSPPSPVTSSRVPTLRDVVLPMLLLLPGAFFLLFGAVLILFSADGVLTLRWNAHYWILYLALAIPLLYFGWRSLNQVEHQAEEGGLSESLETFKS